MAIIIIGSIFTYLFIGGIYASLIKSDYIRKRPYYGDYIDDNYVIEAIFWVFCFPVRMGAFLGSKTNLTSLFNFIQTIFNKTIKSIKNNMKSYIAGIFSLLLLAAVAWGTTAYINYSNKWAQLTAQYEAQERVDEVIYDEVWKTIQQEANISDRYAEEFENIYVNVMDARYNDGGGQLMLWITEQNPNFTPELHHRLITIIENKRAQFTENQTKLINIHAELVKLTTTIPSSWFLGGRHLKAPRIITSTRTGEAFRTGTDNDTSLFPSDSSK